MGKRDEPANDPKGLTNPAPACSEARGPSTGGFGKPAGGGIVQGIMRLRLWLAAGALIASIGQATAGSDTPFLFRALVLDGHQLKWGAPRLGSGTRVSYAVVAREQSFPGARNCSRLGPMQQMLARSRVPGSMFQRELRQAFDAWEAVAGITFAPGDAESADILIGVQITPRGRAFTNVSYDQSLSTPGVRSITRALICFNPTQPWKIGFDGDLDVYDLRYTLMHEIGHAIGLNHPNAQGALMYFDYHEKFRTLQAGDVQGAVSLYGEAAVQPLFASRPAVPGGTDDVESWGEAAFSTKHHPGASGAR